MRLIDADALRAALFDWGKAQHTGEIDHGTLLDAIEMLDNAPTVSVPVIRCTECKYFGPSEYAGYWHCENWGVESNALTAKPETFYCADAERKEP